MCAIDISFGLNEPAVVCLHTCVYPWDKSIGTCPLTIPRNMFFPVFLFNLRNGPGGNILLFSR